MTSLAERLAPHLAGTLVHPGDDKTDPFPLAAPPMFKVAQMPAEVAKDMADQAGFPHADIPLIYTQAWIHLVKTVTGIDLNDPELAPERQAEIRAAAAVNERRRNEKIDFHTPCGAKITAMARGFDTGRVTVPCEMVRHECKGKR
jgi:hypothetical protein